MAHTSAEPRTEQFEPRFEELRGEVSLRVAANCTGIFKFPLSRVLPSRSVTTCLFPEMWQRFTHFEVLPDDVWVLSFPKCGTTWTQEMVWLIGNNCDFEAAKKTPLNTRFPFFEYVAVTRDTRDEGDTVQRSADLPRPRYIKSHLPYELLPTQLWTKKPKIVYVARDVKDAALSYYHHHRLWNGYTGSLEDFLLAFMEDGLVYCPFWEHVLKFWELRAEPFVLFNTFEQMRQDLPAVVRRTAQFLGRQLSAEQVSALCDHLSFNKMKQNPAVNKDSDAAAEVQRHGAPQSRVLEEGLRFMRSGEVGGWRREMPAHLAQAFDRWSLQKTAGTGFPAGYDQ